MKTLTQPQVCSAACADESSHAGTQAKVLRGIIQTHTSWPALVARLTLAFVMFPHGAQKTIGWFGGYGFGGTMSFFTETMHIPWLLALAAILAESLGSLALAAGLGTRLAALAIATNMAVAALTSHIQNGFFMDWFRNQKGEGYEYHLLALALCGVTLMLGGGSGSLDLKLSRRFKA